MDMQSTKSAMNGHDPHDRRVIRVGSRINGEWREYAPRTANDVPRISPRAVINGLLISLAVAAVIGGFVCGGSY